MSYRLKVIKDSPIGFWMLDESSSSSVAMDYSGCNNNGAYTGSPATNILPLVPGGGSGTKITNLSYITFPITNNYYTTTSTPGMATKYSSDNDFTLECWINQSIESTSKTTLFADNTSKIGLYWDRGDIVFNVSQNDEVRYPVTYSKRSMHIVGVYSISSISLYVDARLVATKSLSPDFKFTNTAIAFTAGPTSNVSDSFIVDAPAIYRYSLSPQSILSHFNAGSVSSSAIQIVAPDQGILFSGTDASIRAQFQYSYPINRRWTEFLDENTYYDEAAGYISFYKTDTSVAKTFIMEDFFMVPSGIPYVTSKVEWRNDLNISVESSVDGLAWQNCTNGMPLPQYTKDGFSTTGLVYLKITMTTSDASKYLPRLAYFAVSFYTNKDVYADNFGYKISSPTEYYIGSLNYPVLSRHYDNGIRTKAGSGFNLSASLPVNSTEMLFTPSTSMANTLIYLPAAAGVPETKYAWNGSGTVSKANILSIFINGVDRTSATNISSFLVEEELHHIVINFTAPISGDIQFNYLVSGGPTSLYNNIAVYPNSFTQQLVSTHYGLYIGKASVSVSDPSISVTEKPFRAYNNDWIVLQSI
jgi:hypothetical protein